MNNCWTGSLSFFSPFSVMVDDTTAAEALAIYRGCAVADQSDSFKTGEDFMLGRKRQYVEERKVYPRFVYVDEQ